MNVVEPGIEVNFSKVKIFLFLVIFIVLLSYIIHFFFMRQLVYQNNKHWLFIHVFAWGLAYYCGLSIIDFTCLLFQKEPAIIINNLGVYYQPTAFVSFQIPWNYVSEIRTRRVKYKKYPVLIFEYDPQLFEHISFLRKFFFYPKLLMRPKGIVFRTPLLSTTYKELYTNLSFALQKNQPQSNLNMEP